MNNEKETNDVNETGIVNYFDGAGQQLEKVSENAGAVAIMARSEAEIKMKAYLAHIHPRNEYQAFEAIQESMGRPSMAEKATYNYPRGGSEIKGPSVYLAREMARLWGNIVSEVQIISITEEEVHIRAVAFDLQTNATAVKEDRFKKSIFRKRGGWIKPDERDLRELINKHGAICERNAILQLMPSDLIEDATNKAEATCKSVASGKLKTDRATYIKTIVRNFIGVGVTVEMLENRLGHEIKHITEDEIAELRGIINSLRDGNSKIADHFELKLKREEADFDMTSVEGKEEALPYKKDKKKQQAESAINDGKEELSLDGGLEK